MDNVDKLKITKQITLAINRTDKPRTLLRDATPEQLEDLADRCLSIMEGSQAENTQWLVEHNFPPDITRAARLAMAEVFGEFVSADDIGDFSMSRIWELLQTCVDRRKRVEPHVSDPLSTGRSKSEWTALKDLTKDMWDRMRNQNTDRIEPLSGNKRKWRFRKSLCVEYGFECPEFAEK